MPVFCFVRFSSENLFGISLIFRTYVQKNLPRKDLGMTKLTEEMFQIFDQPEFSFKKIKATHTEEEVAAAKEQFKSVWQIWKQVNQTVAAKLPAGEFAKAHVES